MSTPRQILMADQANDDDEKTGACSMHRQYGKCGLSRIISV